MRDGPPSVLISALHYDWTDLPEAFRVAADELGLDGIEFSLQEKAPFPAVTPGHAAEIARLAAQFDTQVTGHVWGDVLRMEPADGIAQLRRWLSWAAPMRTTHLVVHGGTHADRQRGPRVLGEMIAEVADDYRQEGVVLCLENHYDWDYHDSHELLSTPEEFQSVFDVVDGPAVGICIDYGHSHMTGNTAELLEQLAPHVVYTHLADNMGVDDDHLAFGQGTVDWRGVLETTRAVGFRGPFTIEFPVRGPSRTPLERCLTMLREIFGGVPGEREA